jgi:hypothetical protein
MTTVVIVIVAVLVLLIVGVTYLNIQEEQQKKEKARQLTIAVREAQAEFKDLIMPLAERNYIDSHQKHKLYGVANNFFVFQTVSDNNINNLKAITKKLSYLLDAALNLANDNEPRARELFESLSNAMPESARECSANFYNSAMPQILKRFEEELESSSNEPEIELDENVADDTELSNQADENGSSENDQTPPMAS